MRLMPMQLAALWFLAAAVVWGTAAAVAAPAHGARAAPVVEADVRSDYSHILVKRQGNVRTLVFVRDNGEEAVESMVNLAKPQTLLVPYSRLMFASYLFRAKPERVLIVGLGGGGMVHFLKHHDPELRIDAVEIDPAVVKIADKYFDVRSEKNVTIITADGLKFLAAAECRYDVIYLDAFLKPSQGTDAVGVPLEMKTRQFYKDLQAKLADDGVVAFNLNRHQASDEDLKAIRAAFGQVYVFGTVGGSVALATRAEVRDSPAALRTKAGQLDRRLREALNVEEMLQHLAK